MDHILPVRVRPRTAVPARTLLGEGEAARVVPSGRRCSGQAVRLRGGHDAAVRVRPGPHASAALGCVFFHPLSVGGASIHGRHVGGVVGAPGATGGHR